MLVSTCSPVGHWDTPQHTGNLVGQMDIGTLLHTLGNLGGQMDIGTLHNPLGNLGSQMDIGTLQNNLET